MSWGRHRARWWLYGDASKVMSGAKRSWSVRGRWSRKRLERSGSPAVNTRECPLSGQMSAFELCRISRLSWAHPRTLDLALTEKGLKSRWRLFTGGAEPRGCVQRKRSQGISRSVPGLFSFIFCVNPQPLSTVAGKSMFPKGSAPARLCPCCSFHRRSLLPLLCLWNSQPSFEARVK